jgi:hypothetical protein
LRVDEELVPAGVVGTAAAAFLAAAAAEAAAGIADKPTAALEA